MELIQAKTARESRTRAMIAYLSHNMGYSTPQRCRVQPKAGTEFLVDRATDGTQAIRRAAAILKHIARCPESGTTINEVSASMGLSRSTTHRILKCLVSERLVSQSDDARRYVIGDLTSELGLATNKWRRAVLEWRGALETLAAETGVTAYLMGRSGDEAVCLEKAEGPSIVRVIPVHVGQRRPLGVGAGACALLAALPNGAREATIRSVEPYLPRYASITGDTIRDIVRKALQSGFAESRGNVVAGVYGLAVAIPADEGTPFLALSIAAHHSVVTASRISDWKRCLRRAVKGDF